MEKQDVKAVILRVTIDGQEVVTAALGESMTGVPATTDMHFRNGAVAFFYVSTLLLRLVDQKVVTLDDPLADLAARSARCRTGHAAHAGQLDGRLPRLRAESEAEPGGVRRSLPPVDAPGADRPRPLHAAGLRTRDQLGLLPHRLRHPGAGAGEDHRPAAGRRPAGAGPRPHGPAQHRRLVDAADHRAGPARLQRGAAPGPRHPRRHAFPRGVDLLESRPGPSPRAPSRPPTSST